MKNFFNISTVTSFEKPHSVVAYRPVLYEEKKPSFDFSAITLHLFAVITFIWSIKDFSTRVETLIQNMNDLFDRFWTEDDEEESTLHLHQASMMCISVYSQSIHQFDYHDRYLIAEHSRHKPTWSEALHGATCIVVFCTFLI